MARNKCKPRLIPEQDKRICGGICLCQLTVVLSCVALVYLTVAIYMPSHRAFNSGFEAVPVTCQTHNTTMLTSYCNWASCGEWCLTKTSGFCPQIHVSVRRNGTDVIFEDCDMIQTVACPPPDYTKMEKFNCNNGSECAALTGLFNCSLGHCLNMSQIFLCKYRTEGAQIDAEKDNAKMDGFFECKESRCTKVKRMNPCDRYCKLIPTLDANVYLSFEDSVMLAKCDRALATTECNGTEEGFAIPPEEIWKKKPNEVLLSSCLTVVRDGNTLRGIDCINGTLLEDNVIPKPLINFTVYWDIVSHSQLVVDPQLKFLPPQQHLTIYNNSRLYINLEGCVNTLQGECVKFLSSHGRDGKNQTAHSRFPCYYNKKSGFYVVSRFNLNKVWRELIIAISIPSVLFVISFITLCVITQSVQVGDDTKMRCKCCIGDHDPGIQKATPVVPDLNVSLHKSRPKYKPTVNPEDTMPETKEENEKYSGVTSQGVTRRLYAECRELCDQNSNRTILLEVAGDLSSGVL